MRINLNNHEEVERLLVNNVEESLLKAIWIEISKQNSILKEIRDREIKYLEEKYGKSND